MSLLNKRNDFTQTLFKEFIKKSRFTPYGYSANNVVVLTTDPKLNRELLELEKERLVQIYREKGKDSLYKIVKLNDLGLGDKELSSQTELKSWFKNAILFEEESIIDGYRDNDLGGYVTLIVSENANDLKRYVDPVVKRHIEECRIPTDGKMLGFSDMKAPYLYVLASIDNAEVKLGRNGFYSTRLTMKSASSDIISSLSNKINCINLGPNEQNL